MNTCWTGTVDSAPRDLEQEPLECAERTIPEGKLVVFENLFGQSLLCLQGLVWLTQQNDSRDIVLGPGQSFRFDRSGKAVVQSLQRARVLVK